VRYRISIIKGGDAAVMRGRIIRRNGWIGTKDNIAIAVDTERGVPHTYHHKNRKGEKRRENEAAGECKKEGRKGGRKEERDRTQDPNENEKTDRQTD
jgi:hypothetical protein